MNCGTIAKAKSRPTQAKKIPILYPKMCNLCSIVSQQHFFVHLEAVKHKLTPVGLSSPEHMQTLVEHRRVVDMESCQLNVFETHERADNVRLEFGDLLLTSMLRGKKVMHLPGREAFDYLPGESVVVRPNETMRIDFPDATPDEPTQCIALAMSRDAINGTLALLDERFPLLGENERWRVNGDLVHLNQDAQLVDVIQRIIRVGLYEQGRSKDALAAITLQELLVRLMQTGARKLFAEDQQHLATHHPLAAVMAYIEEHLDAPLDCTTLAGVACMSRPHFQRKFKEAFGWTPGEYVQHARMEAARRLLVEEALTVNEVAYAVGFRGPSPFIRAFRQSEGVTPKRFQLGRRSTP